MKLGTFVRSKLDWEVWCVREGQLGVVVEPLTEGLVSVWFGDNTPILDFSPDQLEIDNDRKQPSP